MMGKATDLLGEFDESTYLALNSDVSEAVRHGYFCSGWEHYVLHGIHEARPGSPARVSEKVKLLTKEDSLPTPPPHLRLRVHGEGNLASFNNTGKLIAVNIESAIQSESIQLNDHCTILDFGCGCGRVLRWFHRLHEHSSFFGTDIDAEAIAWCKETLAGLGTFARNDFYPSLSFSDEYFDLVYSVSVFTHLPEHMQFAWLKELQRVTKRGGYLVLTAHGEDLFPGTDETQIRSEHGFHYASGHETTGLPGFYQTSFHSERYIRDRWGQYFEVRQIAKKAIVNHQDLVLCRRVG
jgi:SAM-dependent methyltransferase